MGSNDASTEVLFGDVPEELRPRILRKFGVTPPLDEFIDGLPLPLRWSERFAVRALRLYRRVRPRSVGDRCAFEPSCSRYAEAVIRLNGVTRGCLLTARRLCRCNARNGGYDLPDTFCDEQAFREGLSCSIKSKASGPRSRTKL
ncbi:MAG: membrane protein insertion efficiency factor YidD [Pseudomonadota bacterium]